MKTRVLFFLSLFTVVNMVSCQNNDKNGDINGVQSALKSYVNGGDTNDVKKLSPLLHKDYRVVLYDNQKDAASILDKSTYLSLIESKKFGGYKRSIDFEDFQFVGEHMASVKVTLTNPEKPTLRNFYSLVKIGGKWLVIQDYVILIP